MSDMAVPLKFDANHGTWRPFRGDLPGQSRRLDLGTSSTSFGAGFTRIERSCRLGITLKGDQIVYVISGEFQVISHDAPTLVAHAGDALLMRQGARLSIGVVGHCHFFYVLSPDMDWRGTLEHHA